MSLVYFVYVIFTRNNIFDWQTSPKIEAEVLHEPQDVGDMWTFESNGIEFRVNPSCPEFLGVEVIKRYYDWNFINVSDKENTK